jgi:hypothetical protein
MYVHAKTGSKEQDNIPIDLKISLYKKVFDCIKTKKYYKITVDVQKNKLLFNI